MPNFPSNIEYSDKYYDDTYEFRHVTLNQATYNSLPQDYIAFYKTDAVARRDREEQSRYESTGPGTSYIAEVEQRLLSDKEWRGVGI